MAVYFFTFSILQTLLQRQLVCTLLGQIDSTLFYDNLKSMVAERVGSLERMKGIEDLGLLKEDPVKKCETPIDTLSHYLSNKLRFGEFIIKVV